MSNRTNAVPPKLQAWIQARKRHRLSHTHVQMARELGMNPKKLGSIDNHRQEPWKAPLPEFIEQLYLKRFGRERPEVIVSIEERARQLRAEKGREGRTALRGKHHRRRALISLAEKRRPGAHRRIGVPADRGT